jgi:hypothetical protein
MSLFILHRPTPKKLRVIDGLIAEHLFGWKWFTAMGLAYLIPPWGQEECCQLTVHWTEGLKNDVSDSKRRQATKCYEVEAHYSGHDRWILPEFTRDPASAFQVIEELTKRHVTTNLMFRKPYWPQWVVNCASAQSLQLAVCLYALERLDVRLPFANKRKARKR